MQAHIAGGLRELLEQTLTGEPFVVLGRRSYIIQFPCLFQQPNKIDKQPYNTTAVFLGYLSTVTVTATKRSSISTWHHPRHLQILRQHKEHSAHQTTVTMLLYVMAVHRVHIGLEITTSRSRRSSFPFLFSSTRDPAGTSSRPAG